MAPKKNLHLCGLKAAFLLPLALTFATPSLFADGIYREGVGAKSMSLGGADVSWADDPLTSLGGNPAGLGFMDGQMVVLGATSVLPKGEYKNRVDSNGRLKDDLTAMIEGAVGMRISNSPVHVAIGFFPQAGLTGDWHYSDVPGGADGNTTYGAFTPQKSEIILLRTAFGVGIQLTSKLSIGASVGLVYNENRLQMPYVFQNEPTLPPGFKTLLDLQTDGWGVDGNVGIQYRPTESLLLGAVYKTEMRIHSDGDASGNAGVQLAALGLGAARPDFHYNAEVDNVFPQSVSVGATWKALPKLRISGQVDWIDWSAFNTLPVKLTNGNNSDINGVVGSNTLNDEIPLKWKDCFVYRLGVEYDLNENFTLRAGYVYGKSPVPTETLTPLTGVITEHTLAVGLGYTRGNFSIDGAYQYTLPKTRTIASSSLAAGELNGSTLKVSIQTFTLTARYKF